MALKYIGVIVGGPRKQSTVNSSHGLDIGKALEGLGYEVSYYDLSQSVDVERLLQDREEGCLDIVFNNAAGKCGGDGSIEGLLAILGIPFVGSDLHATAVAFDKQAAKIMAHAAGLNVASGTYVTEEEYTHDQPAVITRIHEEVPFPLIVKASRGSDSIGISVVRTKEELIPALAKALEEDDVVVIEQFIEGARNVDCMVLGSGRTAVALRPVEYQFQGDFYVGNTEQDLDTFMMPQNDHMLPAIQEAAVQIHQAIGCRDYSRSDFLISKDGQAYFLEINAHAGLGMESPTVFIAQHDKGWSFEQTVAQILDISAKRQGII